MLPKNTVDCLRQFNDLSLNWYGIECTLFIPNNIEEKESLDMYASTNDLKFTRHDNQLIWFEWHAKDIVRLRRNNAFAEGDPPITARFKTKPEVTVGSYIILPTRYLDNQYNTLEFECVSIIMEHTNYAEIYRRFKMAPRRK